MNKTSQFFLFLIIAISFIGAYNFPRADNAVSAGTRFLALSGFFLMSVSLSIGPLAIISPRNFAALIEPRRAVGIASFFMVALHVLLSFGYQFEWDFSFFLKNFPMQVGTIAFVLMVPLAITSADWATRKIGQAFWKNLQRLTYPAFAFSLWHFVFKANGLSLKSPNFSEFAVVLFALATIALQVAGFSIVRKRKAEAKRKEDELKKSHANSSKETPQAGSEQESAPEKSP